MKKNDLHEIMQELKKERLKGIDSLYKSYAQTIKKIAFSIVKNVCDSEDVMQEVFMKIQKMDKKNLPDIGEMNWIYLVTKNTAIDFIKRRKRIIHIDEIYNYNNNNNDEIEKIISKASCEKLFMSLSKKEKEIVTLKIFSGFSFKKIGILTNYPTSTVSWKYYKSMDMLKSNIEKGFMCLILVISFILNNNYRPKGNVKISLKKELNIVIIILFLFNMFYLIKNQIKSHKNTIKKSSIK